MLYISSKEAAEKWGVSERMVRKYCIQGRIAGAKLEDSTWFIPQEAPKPKREVKEVQPLGLGKKVVNQKKKNNHYGIYEYLQVNLAYSSSRMASNRMTRTQVIELYRTGKISVAFEPLKVDDVIEINNHFRAFSHMASHIMDPLTTAELKRLHTLLFYGTEADRNGEMRTGVLRNHKHKYGCPPGEISTALSALMKAYGSLKKVTLNDIIAFHVAFERIHPFEDGNGRLGRLIMLKECLRHQITPFIIEDKQRGAYHKGIANWETEPEILASVVDHATTCLESKLELCRLLQYAKDD